MKPPSFFKNRYPGASSALLSLICAGLVIFGVAGFICFRQFESAKTNALNADNTAAGLVASVLAEHEQAATGVLLSYAQRPLLIRAVKEKDLAAVHSHLEGMKRNNPDIDLIFLTDKDGTIWANYPIYPEAIGQNVSDRDWYRGVSVRWEPYTSAVFHLIVGNKPLAVATAVPVLDEKGEVAGIIGNSHRLDFMVKTIQTTYLHPDTAVNILDQKGQLLFSNKYLFGDRITTYPLLPVVRQAIKGSERLIETPEPYGGDGKSYLTQYPVEHTGWTVVVERKQEDILRSAYRGFIEIGAIAILLFSLTSFFIFYHRKVALLKKAEELLLAEKKLRESEQAEMETRIRAEQAVRDGEERLRFALETSRTGAWDLDLADHTAFRSLEHDRVFGYAALLPRWTYEMFLDHVLAEDRGEVDAKFRHAVETQSDWSFECRIRRADGESRWIWAAGRHRADAAGAPRRMAGIVQDVTERKRAENRLRESEEALRQANEYLEQRVLERTLDLQNLTEQLEGSRHELRKLASELVMAEERERKRIAGVLHDEIAQTLAAARMRLDLFQDIPADQKDETLKGAKALLVQSIQETRGLMNDLGNPLLFDMGLKPACEALANRLMERHPVRIRCDMGDAYKHLDPELKTISYQVVRELLNNVVKHSRAQNAQVSIEVRDGHFRVKVTDDGAGFNPQTLGVPTAEGGFGLYSMRERLIAIDGSLGIESTPGVGTVVTAILPAALD
jgi:PAS domain S-box-containing protein